MHLNDFSKIFQRQKTKANEKLFLWTLYTFSTGVILKSSRQWNGNSNSHSDLCWRCMHFSQTISCTVLPGWPPSSGGLTISCINLSRISDRNRTKFSPLALIRSARLYFSSISNWLSFLRGGNFCSWAILHNDKNLSSFSSCKIYV